MKRTLRIATLLIAIVALFTLASCAPSNAQKARAKMEKAGYTVVWYALDEPDEDGVVGRMTCGKNLLSSDNTGLTAVLYKTAKQAKAAYKETKEELGDDLEGLTRVGKWIVYGDADAVKAFK